MRAQIRTYPTAQFYNELNYLQGEFTALRKYTSTKKTLERRRVFLFTNQWNMCNLLTNALLSSKQFCLNNN